MEFSVLSPAGKHFLIAISEKLEREGLNHP
jgi:hypothetical protein